MMHQSLEIYLVLAALLFSIGLYGILSRRNLIAILISLELMLNSANINLIAFDRFNPSSEPIGQTVSLFVIALAAAEICVALSIVLLISRRGKAATVDETKDLAG